MKNQNKQIVDSAQIVEQIAELVTEHFSNWPLVTGQISAMEILTKAASHPTIKDRPHNQWEDDADTIIQQYQFNIKLIQLVAQVKPEIVQLVIPVAHHERST